LLLSVENKQSGERKHVNNKTENEEEIRDRKIAIENLKTGYWIIWDSRTNIPVTR